MIVITRDGADRIMTLVSPTVPNPGDEANASDISTPITQLALVINGGLDDTNISGISGSKIAGGTVNTSQLADNSVTFAKLLSTIFSGQVTSSANAGTAGGTIYRVNLGGIKILWAIGSTLASNATGTGTQYTFTLPASFFTTVTGASATAISIANSVTQFASIVGDPSTSTVTVACIATSGSSTTQKPAILVIGT